MSKTLTIKVTVLAIFALILNATAFADSLDDTIHELQKEWAIANYETDDSQTEKAFADLTIKAEEAVRAFPDKAEPLMPLLSAPMPVKMVVLALWARLKKPVNYYYRPRK